jgi:hypothetical protein
VRQLLDCTTGAGGCRYGNVAVAYQYLASGGGIVVDDDYDGSTADELSEWGAVRARGCGTIRDAAVVYGLSGFGQVDPTDSALAAVLAKGPVAVAVDAGAHTFQFYKSGIYNDPSCSSEDLNHAMVLVGWGVAGNLSHWILRNSWTESWGENGYIRILRRDDYCGVVKEAIIPVVAPVNPA